MTHGPNARPISSAVSAAITARKVMYWNTRKKANSGESVCSHWARLSSMRRSGLRQQRCDDLFHLHETRALDEHRHALRRLRKRRDETGDVVEVARAGEGAGGVRAEPAHGPERVETALPCIGTDFGVERDALVADLAHVAKDEPARAGQTR